MAATTAAMRNTIAARDDPRIAAVLERYGSVIGILLIARARHRFAKPTTSHGTPPLTPVSIVNLAPTGIA